MRSMTLSPKAGERALILVADGTRANGFEIDTLTRQSPPTGSGSQPSDTHGVTLKPVQGMELAAESLDDFDLNRHPPAQSPRGNAPSGSISGGGPRETTMERIKQSFAKTIVDKLNTEAEKGSFDEIILIASPAMLGQIKSGLSKRTVGLVSASHAADLTHFKGPELLSRINHIVRSAA